MHANLVSAAGIDPQFEQRELAKFGIDSPLYRVMRYSFASTLAPSCHSRAAAAVAGVIGRARAGVDHHARGLVDYREIVVFVDNFQRNFFRYRAQRTGLRLAEKGDAFAATQTQGRLGFQIIYQDLPFRNQLLNSCTAQVGEVEDQELVQAFASSFRGG